MDQFENIEKYILDQLTASEKLQFEKAMTEDPALKNEVEEYRTLILAADTKGLRDLLKTKSISDDQTIVKSKAAKIKYYNFKKWAVAASIGAVVLCGWLFLKPDATNNSSLYADAFTSDPGLPTPMSEVTNYTFYDAMVDYKVGKYDMAIDKWKTAEGTIGADTLNYYLGVAHINNNKPSDASEYLARLNPNSSFYHKAQWQLIGILISQNKLEEAQSLLQNVPSDIHPLFQKIKKQLEK